MDQAMGDLQAQLEEVRRMWDDERQAKERALLELDVIRAGGGGPNTHISNAHPNPFERRGGEELDPRDKGYHPSDRHHHIQHDGVTHIPGADGQHMSNDPDIDISEPGHLPIPRDPELAGGRLGLRDPDLVEGDANGSVDPEADAEGEGDDGDENGDERHGKKRID